MLDIEIASLWASLLVNTTSRNEAKWNCCRGTYIPQTFIWRDEESIAESGFRHHAPPGGLLLCRENMAKITQREDAQFASVGCWRCVRCCGLSIWIRPPEADTEVPK